MRKSTWWSWLKKIGNGDATKILKNEKRNIYLSVKLMKMIHNQGWHKENPMHVCLFVFEIKIREQCELQTRMKNKKYIWKIQKKNEKKNLNPPPQNPEPRTRNKTRFLQQTSFVWFLTLLKKWTWVCLKLGVDSQFSSWNLT
jgi:hypothetical protein